MATPSQTVNCNSKKPHRNQPRSPGYALFRGPVTPWTNDLHPQHLTISPGASEAPLYFNPLDLRDIPPNQRQSYLRQLLSLLLNTYFKELRLLSVEGAEYLLLRALDFLSRDKDTFTFQDLYSWILNFKAVHREKDWKTSVSNILYWGYPFNRSESRPRSGAQPTATGGLPLGAPGSWDALCLGGSGGAFLGRRLAMRSWKRIGSWATASSSTR